MPLKVADESLAPAIYKVSLDRSATGNALDPSSIQSLREHLSLAESRQECSVFAICASGPAFCAGADIEACNSLIDRPEDLLQFFTNARSLMYRLHTSRLISVAIVNGLAAAGGLELVAACNIVIASESATFADNHARYGFIPAFGATALLPLKIGYTSSAWLMLAGGKYTAQEAHIAKLVSVVLHDATFTEDAHYRLSEIGRLDPVAISTIKKLLNQSDAISHAMDAEKAEVENHLRIGAYNTKSIDF